MIEMTRRELKDLLVTFFEDNDQYLMSDEDREEVVQQWLDLNEDLVAQFDSDERESLDDE